MKKKFAYLSVIVFLIACNNNSSAPTATPVTATKETIKPEQRCYRYTVAKDTVNMNLHLYGDSATGELSYNYFAKDKNTGIIHGNMRGDTLFAEYKFISEGIESTREVAFLKQGDDFVEGYGDSKQENGKVIFTNTGRLLFNNRQILKNVACEK